MSRAFQWVTLVLATLAAIGVFVQVYLIAAYLRGRDADVLDAHENVGGIVHGVEVLVLIAALVGFWRRWGTVWVALALAVVGTVQIGIVEADNEWVGAFHGLLALVILILAAVVTHRAMRALGLGRGARTGAGA